MKRIDTQRLAGILDRFERETILVLGDVVLDEYLWGEVERISPEAPVPVVHLRDESTVLGGAGNVVRNLVALGGRCRFCSVVGDDLAGARVRSLLKDLGVDPEGLVVVDDRPTTRKSRVVARSQQVVRFDRETDAPIPARSVKALLAAIEAAIPHATAAIVEDYGKGMLAPEVLGSVMRRLHAAGIPVAVDPKASLARLRGASLLKPNLRETEALSGVRVRHPEDLDRAVARIRQKVGPADVVVTRGAHGMTVYPGTDAGERGVVPRGVDVPTVAQEVFDVQGAGDTVIAALELARRAGAPLLEAAVVANAAAGVVVGKIGTATADRDEVRELLPAAVAAARRRSP